MKRATAIRSVADAPPDVQWMQEQIGHWLRIYITVRLHAALGNLTTAKHCESPATPSR
jgi:transposase InsO family protein